MLVIALLIAGCAASAEPVKLLTGWGLGGEGAPACHTVYMYGLLVPDPDSGTALEIRNGGGKAPVMWLPGSTAVQIGSEVQVLDPTGKVIATTGKQYQIPAGDGYACALGGVFPVETQ